MVSYIATRYSATCQVHGTMYLTLNAPPGTTLVISQCPVSGCEERLAGVGVEESWEVVKNYRKR